MFLHLQTVLNALHHTAFNVRLLLFFTEKILLILEPLNNLSCLWNWCLGRWRKLRPKTLMGGHSLVKTHAVLFVQHLLALCNIILYLADALSSQLTQRPGRLWVQNFFFKVAIIVFIQIGLFNSFSFSLIELGLVEFVWEVFGAHFNIKVPVFIWFLPF